MDRDVCIWPDNIKEKDINDMAYRMSTRKIQKIIDKMANYNERKINKRFALSILLSVLRISIAIQYSLKRENTDRPKWGGGK